MAHFLSLLLSYYHHSYLLLLLPIILFGNRVVLTRVDRRQRALRVHRIRHGHHLLAEAVAVAVAEASSHPNPARLGGVVVALAAGIVGMWTPQTKSAAAAASGLASPSGGCEGFARVVVTHRAQVGGVGGATC